MVPREIRTDELQLGDMVTQNPYQRGAPWSTCIVKQISDDEVTLFRPYGTTADFSYTGGVICYVGIEEFFSSTTYESPSFGEALVRLMFD